MCSSNAHFGIRKYYVSHTFTVLNWIQDVSHFKIESTGKRKTNSFRWDQGSRAVSRPGKIPIEVHRFGTIPPCTITLNAEEESDSFASQGIAKENV